MKLKVLIATAVLVLTALHTVAVNEKSEQGVLAVKEGEAGGAADTVAAAPTAKSSGVVRQLVGMWESLTKKHVKKQHANHVKKEHVTKKYIIDIMGPFYELWKKEEQEQRLIPKDKANFEATFVGALR
eukprot:Lankesteria_metandrocarpae@DN9692_c0_g1_i1.p1